MSKCTEVVVTLEDHVAFTDQTIRKMCATLSRNSGQAVDFERQGGYITFLTDGNPTRVLAVFAIAEALLQAVFGDRVDDAVRKFERHQTEKLN